MLPTQPLNFGFGYGPEYTTCSVNHVTNKDTFNLRYSGKIIKGNVKTVSRNDKRELKLDKAHLYMAYFMVT